MQEFVEARRKVSTGPIVTFSETQPKELVDNFNIENPIGNVGFVSFGQQIPSDLHCKFIHCSCVVHVMFRNSSSSCLKPRTHREGCVSIVGFQNLRPIPHQVF